MPPVKKRKRRVLRCCVPHCDSTEKQSFGEDDNNDGVKLYKFPADKPLMRKWVAQIGRGPNFIPIERTRICSKHFQTGRRNYKPSHVDYIPNIFWYNTAKNSEFCSGCRRKVCKCDVKEQESTEPATSTYVEFSETDMYQLLETIEAETVELEDEGGDIDTSTNVVEGEDNTLLDDPNAITASCLDEDCIHTDATEPDCDSANLESYTSPIDVVIPLPRVVERTNVDEIIDSCVRGEDTVGEDILLRQYRKTCIEEPVFQEPEQELLQEDYNVIEIEMECQTETSITPTIAEPCSFDHSAHTSTAPDPDCEGFAESYVIDTNQHFVLNDPSNTTASNPQQNEGSQQESQTLPVDDPNSLLEVEWRRRERMLVKKHKAEEKRMVLEMIKNNQVKNQAIEQLKTEIKEIKRNEKSQHAIGLELEKKIRAEYEDHRKADIKNILDEANSNLSLLQTRWTEEKRVLIEANSSLAKLCNGELEHLNELQAEFMCSVISACSSSQAGISAVPPPQEPSLPPDFLSKTLRFETCSESNEWIKYFTGIPTVQDFNQFYSLLEPNAKKMSYWNGKSWTANPPGQKKVKSSRIDIKNRLFLTLARYRRGFATKELGFFYNCDPTYISCLFITFSKLMENDLVDLFLKKYDYVQEFAELPEIVQTHYTKLYAALRVVEIRLENHVTFVTSRSHQSHVKPNPTKSSSPTYKILFLCSPAGSIFFISLVFPGTTSDRDVILDSKVLDIIPEGSEVFVEQQFDVGNECLAKQVQLLVFPQEITPAKLTEDDPWEIKLLTKCKSRIEKLAALLRYFGIFDKGIHVGGNKGHATTVIRVVLLLQHYVDTYCSAPEPPPAPRLLTAVLVT